MNSVKSGNVKILRAYLKNTLKFNFFSTLVLYTFHYFKQNVFVSFVFNIRNAGLEETQAGIKIAGRNINYLRYTDDTSLMAENEGELKSLLMKFKEESGKVDLKLNIQKTKIRAPSPITSWEIDGETVETVSDYFFGLQKHCRW